VWKQILRRLSSLPLAIGELALIAILSAVGTVIEQNKPLEYYVEVRNLRA
jgi:cytochrome c biogenesis protein ResB